MLKAGGKFFVFCNTSGCPHIKLPDILIKRNLNISVVTDSRDIKDVTNYESNPIHSNPLLQGAGGFAGDGTAAERKDELLDGSRQNQSGEPRPVRQ